jgi:hypothetical protein
MTDYNQAFSTSNIQLEPRLQEYLNRRTFNRENDITPDIPLEQEFSITDEDKRIMKRSLRGRKHIYSKRKTGMKSHFVEAAPCDDDFFTGKDAFKKDPRYRRLQKKMASHRRAQAQIRNFEGIDEDYEIFHRSNPYDDPMNPNVKRPNKISKPYDDPNNYSDDDLLAHENKAGPVGIYRRRPGCDETDASFLMDSRDLVLGSSKGERNHAKYMYNPNSKRDGTRRSRSSYNHKPNIAYHQQLIPQRVDGGLEHNHSITDIIGNLDDYNHHLEENYDYIEAEVDQDSHAMRPSARDSSSRGQYNGYRCIPYGYGGGLADISVENSLRGGIRDSRRKTTGFWNPFEHQFDYIDSDISSPDHTVEMRPQSTRKSNRTMARPESIAAQSDRRLKARHDRLHQLEESICSHESHAQRRGYADPNRDTDDYHRNRYHR